MATSTLPSAPVTDAVDDASEVGPGVSVPGNGRANYVGPGWISLIVTALCRGLLVMIASMTLWAVLPAALGWHVTVVMSGSMEPALRPGDVVASRPISGSAVRPGQVVLADDPDHQGRLRLHRLSKVTDSGQLVLRGDANRSDDSTPVRRNAVHGVGSLRVPFVGAPAYWLRTHQFAALVLTAIAIALIALGAIGRRDSDGPPDNGSGSSATGSGRTRRGRLCRPRRKTLVILTTAALTAATVATDAPAQAATMFKATTANNVSSWTAGYFSCSAAVLSDRPYLYYPFGERSGATAADASGNGRNGTYNTFLGSGVSYGATGPCASDATTGVTLDGTYGWVSAPGSITAPKTFTTEIWFRTTSTNGGALISFRSPVLLGLLNSYDRQLYLDNTGHLVFGLGGNTVSTVASTGRYNDGAWHLADGTVSSTGTQLYVDGTKVGENATMTNPMDATGTWRIGDGGFSGWSPAPKDSRPNASVQGAAIFTSALSANQIALHYAGH